MHKQWFCHLIQNIYLKARAIFSSLYGENSEAFPNQGLEENAYSDVIYLWNKFKNEYKINVINTILKIACSNAISSTSHMSSCINLTATTQGRHHYYHPV